MEFFEVIQKRRSIRRFEEKKFPDEHVKKALQAAVLAPNSSNTQTWDFYWIKDEELKKKVAWTCMNQSAARTASQIVVVTADPKKWKRSQGPLIEYVKRVGAPKQVQMYYEKLIPITYRWGFLNSLAPVKFLISFLPGLFRPMVRRVFTKRDLQDVAVKSAALASQNLMLAITALGGASCPMEGFDEWRLSRLLKLSFSARIVMVIGIGFEAERGTWGDQFRIPIEAVVHEV